MKLSVIDSCFVHVRRSIYVLTMYRNKGVHTTQQQRTSSSLMEKYVYMVLKETTSTYVVVLVSATLIQKQQQSTGSYFISPVELTNSLICPALHLHAFLRPVRVFNYCWHQLFPGKYMQRRSGQRPWLVELSPSNHWAGTTKTAPSAALLSHSSSFVVVHLSLCSLSSHHHSGQLSWNQQPSQESSDVPIDPHVCAHADRPASSPPLLYTAR